MSTKPTDPIGGRIKEMVKSAGGRELAADAMGITVRQLGRIVSGDNAPSFRPVALLAELSGYRLEWVFSGVEPKKVSDPAPSSGALGWSAEVIRAYRRDGERIAQLLGGAQFADVGPFELEMGLRGLVLMCMGPIRSLLLFTGGHEDEGLVDELADQIVDAALRGPRSPVGAPPGAGR